MANRNGGRYTSKSGSSLGKKPRPKKAGEPVYVPDGSPRLKGPRSDDKQALTQVPQVNRRLGEFTIERWSHDGRGLTTLAGKTLFIQGAIPGERVSARLVAEHPRFIEGRVDQILDSSVDRTIAPCPHYGQCGGCQLQHVNPVTQIAMKQNALLQQLAHWGKVIPRRLLPPITADQLGYRARARLGVWYETDGRVSVGFRQQSSNTIAAVKNCLVLSPELDRLIKPLRAWLEQLKSAKSVTHIELVDGGQKPTAILRHVKPLTDLDRQSLIQFADDYQCIIWLEPNGNQGLTDLSGNPADPRLYYSLDSLRLEFHPQDFTQVNPAVNKLMVAQALALLELKPEDRVLDLFCGIGNFTLPIAERCREVLGVEAIEHMVERGRENAARLRLTNAKFLAANLANLTDTQWHQLVGSGITAILLDPPRDGAKDVVAAIKRRVEAKQLSPKRIVYVSCNPATLARDAAMLASAGYTLEATGVIDMFPHTSHVESMAVFLLR